jgi:dolichol-phosphate mannosyltransferase
MPRLLITVCTYNELENIRLLLPELRVVAPEADILVIDDNSPDGTADAVRDLAAEDSQIKLLRREKKLGLGTAALRGFQYGIENHYERLLNMDADFSHHPRYVPALIALSDTCDVAIGSRYVPGGGIVGWNLLRHFMSRSINIYTRLLLGVRTRDNSGSFRCYRVERLAQIDWSRTMSKGYAFFEEVLYRCSAAGCSFAETPIVFEDRRFGQTKISLSECVIALWMIFRLGLQRLLGTPVTHAPGAQEQSFRKRVTSESSETSEQQLPRP